MVFLLFRIGSDRYALDVRRVAEVLPLVNVKRLPHAPPGVAGVFDFRGVPVPVLDLSALAGGAAARERIGTRVVLIDYPVGDGTTRLLGLIAEEATGVLTRDETDFAPTGIANPQAAWLGPVARGPGGLVQRVEIAQLLPVPLREQLFRAMPEGA